YLAGQQVAALDVAGKAEGQAPVRRRGEQFVRSEEHTSELQSLTNLVCRLLLEKKKKKTLKKNISQHHPAPEADAGLHALQAPYVLPTTIRVTSCPCPPHGPVVSADHYLPSTRD